MLYVRVCGFDRSKFDVADSSCITVLPSFAFVAVSVAVDQFIKLLISCHGTPTDQIPEFV